MNCLICKKPMTPRFACSGFNLFWCGDCEFGRLEGDFTPEQVAAFYTGDYYTHSVGARGAGRSSLAQKALTHLAWRADQGVDFSPLETTGKSACDIGCGNGANLRKFKAAGYDTVGVEPDEKAADVARDTGLIVPGTAEDIPIKGSFDVVLMSHVLEHCIDPIKAVQNAASVLSKDGTLIIEVPNNAAVGFRWFKAAWPWTDIPRHLSFFTAQSLETLLRKNGLEIVQTFYTGYTRQFAPDWRQKINSGLSGWPLLAISALGSQQAKYDSIRVHARISRQTAP